MLVELFGSVDVTNSSATQYRYARKRIPLIYVYVISTNPNNAAHVVAILKGTPCIIYLVSAEDFLIAPPTCLADQATGNMNATFPAPMPVEMYAGIGVDRVASMAGARLLYPDASHILIFDGGTALTYTTMVEKRSFGSESTLQLGGGICPGLKLRMRALYDFSDDIPLVDHTLVSKIVKDCMDKKQPLPLFNSYPLPQDATPPDDETTPGDRTIPGNEPTEGDNVLNSERAIVKSILGCVMTEIALLLCCVIRKWLSIPIRQDPMDKNNLPVVIVTGGDGEYYEKLVRRNHSYICETNAANVDLLNHGITDYDCNDPVTGDAAVTRNHFLLKQKKHLQHFGIKSLLIQNTVFVSSKNEQEETLRNQLLGLRVVLPKSTVKRYGTLFAVKRSDVFENDSYLVCSDSDGKILSMGMLDVYCTLSFACCFLNVSSLFRNLSILSYI
jgi:Type III pantothenate kinase